MTRFLRISLALMILATWVCACSDDDPPTAPPVDVIDPLDTESEVVQAFRTAYENRDFDRMRFLLHPDFFMPLPLETQWEFPDLGPDLDWTEETRIAERMFGGTPLSDPDGVLVPGISAISFDVLEQQGAWADTEPGSAFPDTRFALFDVIVSFNRPGYSTLRIEGQLKFYVSGRDTVVADEERTFWMMIGQEDLTGNDLKSVATVNWSEIKAVYR